MNANRIAWKCRLGVLDKRFGSAVARPTICRFRLLTHPRGARHKLTRSTPAGAASAAAANPVYTILAAIKWVVIIFHQPEREQGAGARKAKTITLKSSKTQWVLARDECELKLFFHWMCAWCWVLSISRQIFIVNKKVQRANEWTNGERAEGKTFVVNESSACEGGRDRERKYINSWTIETYWPIFYGGFVSFTIHCVWIVLTKITHSPKPYDFTFVFVCQNERESYLPI